MANNEDKAEKSFSDESVLKKLIKVFRTNNVVRHHFQTQLPANPQGTAKALFKNSYQFQSTVIPGYTGYDRFARYCLAGDTLIATNNEQGYLRIDEIVEKLKNNEEVFTFSYDKNKNSVVLAPITKAWLTKEDEIWEVKLDTGDKIRCTKDHPFMLRDGTYKEAQHLKKDDALMPFYRKEIQKYKRNKNKYRAIFSFDRSWIGEHKIVAEYARGGELLKPEEELHVHHIDFNGLNNQIENLTLMNNREHLLYHSMHSTRLASERWADDGDLRMKADKNGHGRKELKITPDYNKQEFIVKKPQILRFKNPNTKDWLTVEKIIEVYKNGMSIKEMSQILEVRTPVILRRIRWAGYENYKEFSNKISGKQIFCSTNVRKDYKDLPDFQAVCSAYDGEISQNKLAEKIGVTPGYVLSTIKRNGFSSWYNFRENYKNHKVVSVKNTGIKEFVYDITVPEYHNFALCNANSGLCFVHNSDYCLAGDTLISTTYNNEGHLRLDEIVEKFNNGEEIEVLSIDVKTKKEECKKVTAAKLIKQDEIWEVRFKNGGLIRCTKDHEILKSDMTYCQAQNLTPGDFVNGIEIDSVHNSKISENVYDITVEKNHNFAVKVSDTYVFVSNCEMESSPIISKALDIYADETTQQNESGDIIEVVSDDKEIQVVLNELLKDVLHLNGKSIWKTVRQLCKYGDVFYFIDATEENGVLNLIHMPANEVEREEGFDKDNPSAIRFRWLARNNIELPNAYVLHFRIDGNDMFGVFGQSVIEAARRPWRQLVLLEDSMMVYRITRAPERRVFTLDARGVPPDQRATLVEEFNKTLKKNKIVGENGKIDLRYASTLSAEEDYILISNGPDSSTKIETLPGGQNIGDIEDVKFIRANLFAALGIPKAFLTFDEDARSKQTLTQEDIRFARSIGRIQEVVMNELVKLCMIHLYIKGKRGRELTNFKLKMTNPSTVAELQKNELWRARMELVQAAGDGVFDTTFIYKNFLRLSDEAIDLIRKGQIQDKIFQAKLVALENSAGMVPGMGQDMGMGGAMGAPPGMGMPGAPMGMGMPQMGAGAEMGGAMGAPPAEPAMGGMPIAGESFNPAAGRGMGDGSNKDLSRASDGNSRHAIARGIDEVPGISEEEMDYDKDPSDMQGIKRTITHPMGGRESKEYTTNEMIKEALAVYRDNPKAKIESFLDSLVLEMYPHLRPREVKATAIKDMSESVLIETFGDNVVKSGTKKLITESTAIAENFILEQDLIDLDDRANKIISEFSVNKNK